MLIEEITRTQVDEGVKDWIAKAAMATALLLNPSAQAEPKQPLTTQTKTLSKPLINQLLLLKADTPAQREALLKNMAINAGIKGNELAALMAQASHETGGFNFLRELGGPKRFARYEKGNKARALGNTRPGDGTNFRGGGFLQITGRYNYSKIGKQLGIDLERNPALIEKPGIAAATALIYWQDRVKPKVQDFKNVERVTKHINPAQKHSERRKAEFKKYSQQIKKK